MNTGIALIQRLQTDADFRRRMHAFPAGEERLAFLRSEGYDFSPYIGILNQLSSPTPLAGEVRPPGASAGPRQAASDFLGRIRQMFRVTKGPLLGR